jgi:peptidoglycan/LPS O-acetylase OafA/YrhL
MYVSGEQSLRDPRLDGVRGMAILLVMLFHTLQYNLVRGPAVLAWTAVPALGWSGVDLFFVLSGFLITNILLDTRHSSTYALTFYARRTLRIFPLYYAVLMFFLVIAPGLPFLASLNTAWSGSSRPVGLWYWLYLSNIQVARTGAFDHIALSITWSLAIEEQFYLVWPWIVRRAPERTLLWLCCAILVLAPALRLACLVTGSSWIVAYVSTPCRLDTLATGAAIAILARRPGGLAPFASGARRALGWAAALLALIVVYLRVTHGRRPPTYMSLGLASEPLMQIVGYSALCMLWGSLLVAAVTAERGSRLAKTFEFGTLRSLGKYSYGLYLLHLPVAIVLGQWFPVAALVRHFTIAQLAYSSMAIGASYALARLSWLALESPILAWKRYFPYQR